MIKRTHLHAGDQLTGYDTLHGTHSDTVIGLEHLCRLNELMNNSAYDAYHRIHKVFVGPGGGDYLEDIAHQLSKESSPRFLDAAGWAAAESSLVRPQLPMSTRLDMIDIADEQWTKALDLQLKINADEQFADWREDSISYRLALNLAYSNVMRSIVAGGVTKLTRERAYADTLAIAQASVVQLSFAENNHDIKTIGDFLGFQHECNALLSLLYRNDPRYIPLPSSDRAGSGYHYRDQTHDISLINQHWGEIRKVIPIEVKASATRQDRLRYRALIVRGKMHLTVNGKHKPKHTLNAYAAVYDGTATDEEKRIVSYASDTIIELLRLYKRGGAAIGMANMDTPTKFHNAHEVQRHHSMFLANRI